MAPKLTEIVAAAGEVEEELDRLEKATDQMEEQELRSRKHLERAGRLLNEFANAEEALGGRVQALNTTIMKAQQRHVAAAERVAKYASEVSARTETYQRFALRQAEIGQAAANLTAALKPAVEAAQTSNQMEALSEAAEQLDVLVATLNALFEDVRKADFFDLTKDIDSVRQAVISARNKLRGGATVTH